MAINSPPTSQRNPQPVGSAVAAGRSHAPMPPFDEHWIERPIFERFELVARRVPHKLAVDDGSQRLTFADMLCAARHLAHRLQVTPPDRPIGIFLPNDALFPVGALACLAAGRTYVPIDQHYPDDRNARIVQEAALGAAISNTATGISRFAPTAIPHFDIAPSMVAEHAPEIAIADRGVAGILLYTSGSTGNPKGICNDQSAVLQRAVHFTTTCNLDESDRFALTGSPGTIAGVRDTLAALLNGATVYIAEPRRLGMNGILRTFEEHQITVCYLVPAFLRELLALPAAKAACANMRVVRVGGDTILASDIDLCRGTLPASAQVLIGYGSTEAPTLFQWIVPHDWVFDGGPVPCGYVVPGADVSFLNEEGTPAAEGEVAEAVMSSRYASIGTWQNGHLQRDTFKMDPKNPSARIVHTGDLVRRRADGLVELVGRKDRQIKIYGLRVDPGDVEAAIARCLDVTDVVVLREELDGDAALAAYVVARPSAQSTVREIVLAATKDLPRHMRPTRVHVVEAIPRLPSFKADIQRLRQMQTIAATAATARGDPESDTEAKVLAVFRRVLKNDKVGVLDDFFDAGGDSLTALQMLLEVGAQTGVEANLDAFFAGPTVRALCTNASHKARGEPAIILPLGHTDAEDVLYFIHAGFEFSKLTRALNRDLSTGFVTTRDAQALHHLVGGRTVLDAIHRLSEAFARVIVAAPARRRCYLSGHSFGGLLAVETGCKLEAMGMPADAIFLLDTYLQRPLQRVLHDIRYNDLIMRKLRELLTDERRELMRRAQFMARSLLPRKAPVLASATGQGKLTDGELHVRFKRLREEAPLAYRGPSRPLTCEIILFRASQSRAGKPLKHDPDLGWAKDFGPKFKIVPVPGNHSNLVNDSNAVFIAQEINRFVSTGVSSKGETSQQPERKSGKSSVDIS